MKYHIITYLLVVNPAFDTYRIGTMLECVRTTALALACDEGLRVRICVQQSLGEGVFTGLPLALASMRPVLERMDWGQRLSSDEKAQKGDNALQKGQSRKEAMIRFGEISGQEIAEDDDVIIVIAPQNVIGGMVIELLEEMVTAANGRPMVLFNPSLGDRPSSNNMMQVRGRAERRAFQDSFTDIYEMRLLYPSSGIITIPIITYTTIWKRIIINNVISVVFRWVYVSNPWLGSETGSHISMGGVLKEHYCGRTGELRCSGGVPTISDSGSNRDFRCIYFHSKLIY